MSWDDGLQGSLFSTPSTGQAFCVPVRSCDGYKAAVVRVRGKHLCALFNRHQDP